MKKIALLMVCMLLCLSLCSCAVESIADSVPGQDGTTQTAPTENAAQQDIPEGMTADGRHIVHETEDFLITVNPVEFTSVENCEIVVTCENKSDIELSFYCLRMTVNGWQIPVYIDDTVLPGRSSSTELYLTQSDYASLVFQSVDRISFDFEVYYKTDAYNMLLDDTVTVYVSDISEDEVEIVPRMTTDRETVVVDNDQFTFVLLDIYDLGADWYAAHCYLENKCGKPLDIEWNKVSINGWMVEPFYYDKLSPESRNYTFISFDLADYRQLGIEHLDTINELSFEVRAFHQSNEEDFEAARETAVIYPTGLAAEDIPAPQKVSMPGEQIIADDERFTMIVDPVVMLSEGEYCMGIYVLNKGEAEIHLSVSDCALNGQRGNFHFGHETIPAGKCVYHLVTADSFDLNGLDVETLETMGCRVQILNELRAGIFSKQVSSEFEQ